MVRNYPCIVCKKRTKPGDRRAPTAHVKKFLQKELGISPSERDCLCAACRLKFYKLSKPLNPSSSSSTSSSSTSNGIRQSADIKYANYAPPQPTPTKSFCSSPSVSDFCWDFLIKEKDYSLSIELKFPLDKTWFLITHNKFYIYQ